MIARRTNAPLDRAPLDAERRAAEQNFAYQRRLAESLRAEMGLAEAVQWCQELGWEGVLSALLPKWESRSE